MKRLIVALLVCGVAGAADIPVGSDRDQRVQHVNYHSDDVVHLSLDASGRITQIVLEKGESILNYIIGYPEGYEITVAYNTVTLRPISVMNGEAWIDPNKDWDTNISITTTHRIYLLALEITKTPAYMLRYGYPTEAEENRLAVVEQEAQASIKAQPERITIANFNYEADPGDDSESLVPLTIFDNGVHTFIRFAPHADMPVVFTGSGDNEVQANSNVEAIRPDTIRVTTIAPEMTLRLTKGKTMKVVKIINRSFAQAPE